MHAIRYRLAAAFVLLCPMLLLAQAPPKLDKVRIGLPSAGRTTEESGRSRSGAWAPIAVMVKASQTGHAQGIYQLRIETRDLEDQVYQYTVPVPAISQEGERIVQGYIVPGADTAEFSVKLETLEGRVVDVRDKLTRDNSRGELVADLDILFLAAGAGLSSLKQATMKIEEKEEGNKDKGKDEDNPFKAKRLFAFAEDVAALPDRWFGYDAVDVVVLATGKVEFVNGLAQDTERRTALLEWVRRGGQLVLSVGRNKQEVAQLLARMPLLDVKITGSNVVTELPVLSQRFCQLNDRRDFLRKVEVATIAPGPNTHVMVRESFGPVLLEGACGLGRVVLVGFDLDSGEFSTWKGQDVFWGKIQSEVAPYLAKGRPIRGGKGKQPGQPGNPDWQDDEVDGSGSPRLMKADIKRALEEFHEVPTIQFTYVALFLLLYIALVGPLDYFLLKKVFKRLELTWITFPVIVVVVSVAAYFTAYSMKGDDLRVNKIDLLEIDLHEPKQVYGHAWFTLFSPRAESYTVGIEPPVGSWTEGTPEGVSGPVVTLLEGGDNTRRQASQSLFTRPYEYANDASGLRYVPVPVWSTRSLTANWRAPVRKLAPIGINDTPQEKGDQKPPVGGDEPGVLRLGEGDIVSGRLKNNLKVALKDVCLFFREKWYKFGDLAPGEERRIEPVFAQGAQGTSEFFNSGVLHPGIPEAPSGRPISKGFLDSRGSSHDYLKRMMFFRASPWSANNSGLRTLDQSWRIKPLPQFPEPLRTPYRDEVILVMRTPILCDNAEQVIDHDASGSRLWLRDLPGTDKERPAVRGLITQETYVRVFIPVKRRP